MVDQRNLLSSPRSRLQILVIEKKKFFFFSTTKKKRKIEMIFFLFHHSGAPQSRKSTLVSTSPPVTLMRSTSSTVTSALNLGKLPPVLCFRGKSSPPSFGSLRCQKVYPRHSKSVDLELQRCRCGGRLELEQKLKKDGTPMKPRAPSGSLFLSSLRLRPLLPPHDLIYPPTRTSSCVAWQDFIKANMKAAKLENPGSTQSEIMGILKDRYQQTKQGSQRSHPIVLDDD